MRHDHDKNCVVDICLAHLFGLFQARKYGQIHVETVLFPKQNSGDQQLKILKMQQVFHNKF